MKSLIAKYTPNSIPARFYIASIIVYVFGFTLSGVIPWPLLTPTTMISCALIVCGFIAWCLPFLRWLHTAGDRPYTKAPVVILHLLVLLLSTACARYAVTETLGLPPQSFDLTVATLALLFYIPSWLGVLALMLGAIALIGVIVGAVALMMDQGFRQLTSITGSFGFPDRLMKRLKWLMFHGLGALFSSVFLAVSFYYLTENFSPAFKSVTNFIALRSDFHKARNYPGVQPGEYVHPLENGYIAFAREAHDKSVVIGVRLQSTDAQEKVVGTIPSVKAAFAALAQRLR